MFICIQSKLVIQRNCAFLLLLLLSVVNMRALSAAHLCRHETATDCRIQTSRATPAHSALDIEPPFLPASLHRRVGRTSTTQQPRVALLHTLTILGDNMKSPNRIEHGKPLRSPTSAARRELSGFLYRCVRPILNMAYAALRWRWLCATLQAPGS